MLESEKNDWKFILSQKNIQEKKLSEELSKKYGDSSNPLKSLETIQELEKKYNIIIIIDS